MAYYSEAINKSHQKYQKNAIKQIKFGLNRNTDAAIIEWLEKVPNKQGYFKELILADMARNHNTEYRKADACLVHEGSDF